MIKDDRTAERFLLGAIAVVGVLLGLAGAVVVVALTASPLAAVASRVITNLFALDSVQTFWYVTRAAGLVAYLILWLATVWGIAVSSKIFDPYLNRLFSFDFHQVLSLLGIGFISLHVLVLMADKYLPFSLAQVFVPFLSPYRPLWVGVGVIAFYMILLVSITFYLKSRISRPTFRSIHMISYLAFFMAALHGLTAGTDSPLLATQVMYGLTTLVVVFLTAYHIFAALPLARQTARNE